MHGTKTPVIPIALHKQLLLMECEVNRAQLRHDWACVKEEAGELKSRAATIGASLGRVALLGAAGYASARILRAARPRFHPKEEGGSTWWPVVANGTRLGVAVWKLFRR